MLVSKFYNELARKLGPTSFTRGVSYNAPKVHLTCSEFNDEYKKSFFDVQSENSDEVYKVVILTDTEDEEILNYSCSCPWFAQVHTCKHVVACAIKYEDFIFDDEEGATQIDEKHKLQVSRSIINTLFKPRNKNIRKKLKLEIILAEINTWHDDRLYAQFKIGEEKTYVLSNKYNRFISAYEKGEPFKMTAKFTYDPAVHYFSDEDKKILDFVASNYQTLSNSDGLFIMPRQLDFFMNLLKEREFIVKDGPTFQGFLEENPFDTELSRAGDTYTLKIVNQDSYSSLCSSRYIYDSKNMYKLSDDIAVMYFNLLRFGMDSLVFEKKDLNNFTQGVLPLVKDKVVVDESAGEIKISLKPKGQLYFDFYHNAIECKVKLIYGEKTINLFDKVDNILRDDEYESNIIMKLHELGFEENKKKFILDDIDLMGEFLDEELDKLTDKYEIFTSKKIKDSKIMKNINGNANFSIGQDNIMKYDFSLDGVSTSELSSIMDSMHMKKKYHRLKNGNLIDLRHNDALENIDKLAADMDLSEKELLGGEIPKYRAIYYDSLKNRYGNIIRTNNLFDDLVTNFKKYKDAEINLSKEEMAVLRDYQKTGVKWLYNIYKTGFGGILADEMGLGKSIQLIYLIKLLVREKADAKILIVAPTSLVYNWKKEFDKFGSDIKYGVFAEGRAERRALLNDSDDINVYITTYGLVRNDLDEYSNINFDLVAIDEAQNIKNASTLVTKAVKSLNARVKIALTGTPLENSVMELWSIFDFIMPGYLANSKKFKSLYNIGDVDDESLKKLNNLNLQINNFILRRRKSDVAKDLPDKIYNNIYVDFGAEQKKLYMAQVQKTKEEMQEMMATEGFIKARFKILQLLTKLREICIDPSMVFDNYKGDRVKIDELIRLVLETKANGHKMLVFTSYKTALDIVLKEFEKNGIMTYSIDGSTPSKKRMELVEKFNNDNTDVFIITLKAGGTGLNLTSANVVIHLDLWWNPQVENQATDRAHRIGQKETVSVIRLIVNGTIEERILELQEKKRKLADVLIDGDTRSLNNLSNLSEEDIQMLLSMDNNEGVKK